MKRRSYMVCACALGMALCAGSAQAQFADGFDSYANGSNISGQGGWEIWYSGGNDARVDNATANSAPNSLRLAPGSDIVHRFTGVDDGVWRFRCATFMPGNAPPGVGGDIILMNGYGGTGIDKWSMQIALNETTAGGSQPLPFMVESQFDGAVLPITLDQWVSFQAVIDLDTDVFNSWYGGQHLTDDAQWSDNGFASGPGATSIAVVDLFSPGHDGVRFDDVSLTCYSDCDTSTGAGTLDIFDFLCFQNEFAASDQVACDCDRSTGRSVCDIFDFLCFQNAFAAGCP
jgi:hypothetical protein